MKKSIIVLSIGQAKNHKNNSHNSFSWVRQIQKFAKLETKVFFQVEDDERLFVAYVKDDVARIEEIGYFVTIETLPFYEFAIDTEAGTIEPTLRVFENNSQGKKQMKNITQFDNLNTFFTANEDFISLMKIGSDED